jgi:hypothetical protein
MANPQLILFFQAAGHLALTGPKGSLLEWNLAKIRQSSEVRSRKAEVRSQKIKEAEGSLDRVCAVIKDQSCQDANFNWRQSDFSQNVRMPLRFGGNLTGNFFTRVGRAIRGPDPLVMWRAGVVLCEFLGKNPQDPPRQHPHFWWRGGGEGEEGLRWPGDCSRLHGRSAASYRA